MLAEASTRRDDVVVKDAKRAPIDVTRIVYPAKLNEWCVSSQPWWKWARSAER